VVRYLLNQPNKFLKTSWFGSFHQDEQVLHYDDSFAVPWVNSQGVRIQTVNRSLYQSLAELPERSGFLVYSHRVKPDMELIPAWCQPCQLISMDKPRQPEQLASLYQRSAGMIVFERTAAALEAMLCGCPVMFCSHYGLDKSTVFYDGYHDFPWDFDQAAFQQAQQSLGKLADVYDANSIADTQALKVAMDNIISRFRQHEPDVLETTPAYALAKAQQYAQQGDMRAAVLAYRQLIIDHPDYVEAYYRLAETLAKTGLAKPAQDTLLKGEPYLAKLPQHACLDAIREMYMQKLAEMKAAV
jgi:tetratricopeptide (TPR) repeat protein